MKNLYVFQDKSRDSYRDTSSYQVERELSHCKDVVENAICWDNSEEVRWAKARLHSYGVSFESSDTDNEVSFH